MADTIKEIIGDSVVNKAGEEVAVESFCGEGKYIGLYFSAHWCPPCRGFTPVLSTFYNKLRESGKVNFEVVFISCDRDEDSFKDYFNTMPWLAMPFDGDEEIKQRVMDRYEVMGIPTLVILDGATGELVKDDGREFVENDPEGDNFPWKL